MKAIVQHEYGPLDDVLELRAVDKPVAGDGEVLVQVHAASVHPDIWHVVTGRPYVLRLMGAGLRRPKRLIPGTDVAGRVELVGKGVTRFRPGDEVFGESVRGHQWHNGGAYAEYVSVAEDALALKPAGITFEQAATVASSGFIALQGLCDEGKIQAGQKVLINGAGGGVGTFAVQISKAYGADVTAVDSASKLDMLRSIGADRVIDYAQEDFTLGAERYDLILDVASNLSFFGCRRVLAPDGTYVLIGHDHFGDAVGRWTGSLPRMFELMALSPFTSQLPGPTALTKNKERLVILKELLDAGKIKPVVGKTYPLSEVPEAMRCLAEEQVQGKVVIAVA